MDNIRKIVRKLVREALDERYEDRHEKRLDALPATVEKSKEWVGPAVAYKSVEQAVEKEEDAKKEADSKGVTNVYRVVNLGNIEKTMNNPEEISASTDQSQKLDLEFHGNKNFILMGRGPLVTLYDRDVSTNYVDNDKVKTPVAPFNKRTSYDEALVIGKDVKWDSIYADLASLDSGLKGRLEAICNRNRLRLLDLEDPSAPALVKRSK